MYRIDCTSYGSFTVKYFADTLDEANKLAEDLKKLKHVTNAVVSEVEPQSEV